MRVRSISHLRLCLPILLLAAAAAAQGAPSDPQAGGDRPIPYPSLSELNLLLSQVEQVSQTAQLDLAKLRIEKWKTDANTKRGVQADAESLQRNMQAALPEIVGQLRSSPESLPATFKLYRNLDALYDVFGSVVESAGAFGTRDDFQSLQNDFSGLARVRRLLADRIETLANNKEEELTRLRTQVRTMPVQQPAPPPKKVVVDDTEPPKKTVKKKPGKSAKPTPSSPSQKPQGANPPTQPPAPSQPQ